jgi:hypothetical protein
MQKRHQEQFPLSDNLFCLVVMVLADLDEDQRERFASYMSRRGLQIQNYTFEALREAFVELFCAPRSSLENPMYRASRTGRSFCVLDQGHLSGDYGYWVEDDETLETGFVPEIDDIFWTFNEDSAMWVQRPFQARKFRRGVPIRVPYERKRKETTRKSPGVSRILRGD